MAVAMKAGKGQIAQGRRALVLPGDDMVDFEGCGIKSLLNAAVLASGASTIPNSLLQ